MKNLFTIVLITLISGVLKAQTFPRPDVCKACVEDTTGGYISIEDTLLVNPVCNYEVLTRAHLSGIQQNRDTISFFPNNLKALYHLSGEAMGHCIPFQDLAYSPKTAKASMNLRRNVAPEPQPQNIGTKLATENHGRALTELLYGTVKIYCGTTGSVGSMKGINKPAVYWTVIVTPEDKYAYWMPVTGPKIGYEFLNDQEINIPYEQLVANLGFDPEKVIQAK